MLTIGSVRKNIQEVQDIEVSDTKVEGRFIANEPRILFTREALKKYSASCTPARKYFEEFEDLEQQKHFASVLMNHLKKFCEVPLDIKDNTTFDSDKIKMLCRLNKEVEIGIIAGMYNNKEQFSFSLRLKRPSKAAIDAITSMRGGCNSKKIYVLTKLVSIYHLSNLASTGNDEYINSIIEQFFNVISM